MKTFLAVLRTVKPNQEHFGIVVDGCEAADEYEAYRILRDSLEADGVSLCEVHTHVGY